MHERSRRLQTPGLEFQLARETVLNPGERITVTDTDAVTGALRTIAPALNVAIADLVKRLAPRMTPPDPQTRESGLGSTALPPTAGRVRDARVSARHLKRRALALEREAESAGNREASARAAALARRANEIQRRLPTPESAYRARKGAICARAGIPTARLPDGRRGFRFHDMRHSTASIMAARGERPEVIQRVMRHAKVSFTLDRYVKVYREDIRDAVQRSDQRVTDKSTAPL